MSGTADQQMEMPCLGRPFQLGTLYDFRNDSLIPGVTLWGPETLGTATCTKMEGSDFEVITEDSLNEKALHLDVSAGLKLSVLGGLVKAGGSGKFLYDRTTSKNQARVSLKYRATSRFEQLNMSHLGKFEYPRVFDDDIATHVVTGVLYGADAIFVFDRQVESSETLKQVHGNLEAMISALPGIDLKVGGSADLDIQKKGKKGVEEIHCKFYGDFILPKNPTTYQDAVRVYQELPKLLGGVGYPKSVAKKVWLYPLSRLDNKVQRLVCEISSWLVDDVQELSESLHDLEIRTNDLIRNEVYNYFHESKSDLKKLKRLIGSYRSTLLKRLSTLLPQVRGRGADETKLAELLEENGISPFSYERLSSWISGKEMEVSTLAVYLEELKKHQIQFAFSPAEMVGVTSKFDEEKILCFDFNIPAGNEVYLQRMEAYLHGQTVSQGLTVEKVWYKTRGMRQEFQRFVNFVKTNTGRGGVKYVVTNDTTESGGKLGALFMYEDACLTEFKPPDQPGKPQALSVTHNSLQLKWAKPNYGATSVQSYTASYRTSDDPPDQWCTQTSDAECLELTNLTPGSLYYIEVTAETCVGSSPVSEVSEAIQLSPDQPGKPCAFIKNYNCVQLKWSKPKHGANIVQCYTVLYRSTEGQWCKKTNVLEESLFLTNLTPGSLYSFKVVAESSAGSSPSSEVSEVQLPPDQPGKPLTTEVTHNSVQLKWDKPNHGSKIVECYKFFLRLADNPPREWLVQKIDKECLYLKKLTPGSLYYFKVTAESAAGSSPESAVNEVWLPPDQPGKPEIKSATHNSLQLKWSKPKHGADIVQSYTLSYCCVGDPSWSTQTCSEEYAMLTKLIPGSVYWFKVFANSRAGPSPASEVSEVRLSPDQPGKPVASDATYNSVCLKWTKPKHGAETVQSYSISCQAVDNQCYNVSTSSKHEYVTVTKLIPKTVYTFKIRAVSAAGHGPDSDLSNPVMTTLPPPGKPHASNVTHNSLQLNWEKPSHGADSVQFYTVSYCTGNIALGQWNTKRTPVAVESIQLHSLLPKTVYYFKVRAESAAGPSPYSELSDSIETVSPISQPGRPIATKVTHESIALKWEKPERGADDVKYYILDYCALDQQQERWFTYKRHGPQASVCLTGLQPKTIYIFKVRAESSVASSLDSKFSGPIETNKLPPPGKPYASNVSYTGFQVSCQNFSFENMSGKSLQTTGASVTNFSTYKVAGALEKSCLGQPFQLGMLYDCRSDALIPGLTLWSSETLNTALYEKSFETSDFGIIAEDSLSEKLTHLGVDASLKLSILSGLVQVEGAAKFLIDRKSSKKQARVSLKYKSTSRFEQLRMDQLENFEYTDVFEKDIATHVVTGLVYGADAFFVFDQEIGENEDMKKIHGNLKVKVGGLPGLEKLAIGGEGSVDVTTGDKEDEERLHCKFYGDLILPKHPTTFHDAAKVYQELPELFQGKSVPKKVWLYPLGKLDRKAERMVHQISSRLVDELHILMESLHDIIMQDNDLIKTEVCSNFYGLKGDLENMKGLISGYRADLEKNLAMLLPKVRGGGTDETKVAEILKKNSLSPFSRQTLSGWISGKENEVKILATYLKHLKQMEAIQLAFKPGKVANKIEAVVCFDFGITWGQDALLLKMEDYLSNGEVCQKGSTPQPWYRNQALMQEMRQQFRHFISFAIANHRREATRFIVTNSANKNDTETAFVSLYEYGCESKFEAPDKPGKPRASIISHTDLQLNWEIPRYAANVQSYTVFCTDDESSGQWNAWWKILGDRQQLVLHGLIPGTAYFFKVRAETKAGCSPDSDVCMIRLPPAM